MATRKPAARKAAPARKGTSASRRPRKSAAPKKALRADASASTRGRRPVGAPDRSAPTGAPRPRRESERGVGAPPAKLRGIGAREDPERADGSPSAAPAEAALEPAASPAPPADADPARPRAVAIARAGLDKKAEDVLVLDVRGLTSYADYFVLMTADSDRQAGAIADQVDQKLKEGGARKVGVEGYESGRWILIDYGDVVAHVFNREARGFYDLEGLWADAPRFTVAD